MIGHRAGIVCWSATDDAMTMKARLSTSAYTWYRSLFFLGSIQPVFRSALRARRTNRSASFTPVVVFHNATRLPHSPFPLTHLKLNDARPHRNMLRNMSCHSNLWWPDVISLRAWLPARVSDTQGGTVPLHATAVLFTPQAAARRSSSTLHSYASISGS